MISDREIYQSANTLISQHGELAPIQAALRADAMANSGDLDGYAVWRRILKAVDNMLVVEPPSNALN